MNQMEPRFHSLFILQNFIRKALVIKHDMFPTYDGLTVRTLEYWTLLRKQDRKY